jgi:flagellar biosynthesis/type III secretory pathway protein FliH
MQLTNPFIELGFQQGIEKGLAEGIEKGVEKGRREGEVELVLRQLSRRFGALPASQKKLIRKLDLAKIEALGESLFELKSRSDLALWVRTNAS